MAGPAPAHVQANPHRAETEFTSENARSKPVTCLCRLHFLLHVQAALHRKAAGRAEAAGLSPPGDIDKGS
jgi:hypothetical protein